MRLTLAAALAALTCAAAPAAAATYTVDLTLSDIVFDVDTFTDTTGLDAATVTGEIVTDGTLGALTAANVVSWFFTIADSNSSNVLSSAGLNGTVSTLGLDTFTATASALLVGRDSTWGFFELGADPLGRSFGGNLDSAVFSSFVVVGDISGSLSALEGVAALKSLDALAPDESFVLGTAQMPTPIPLPAAAPVLAAGLGLLALMGRRRRAG